MTAAAPGARPTGDRIAVVGLGYVGLPVACAFAAAGYRVTGFDIDAARLGELERGHDRTGSVPAEALRLPGLALTSVETALADADVIIVAVPTPVDRAKRPDLTPFVAAARNAGRAMKPGAIVVFESTVYPGATEEVAVPVLEAESGLRLNEGFFVGYSPERINPGDTTRGFSDITKIVSASTDAACDRLCALYGSVVTAGIHRAPSIRVAEAAKVIENTQRDLNIALMNELSILFHAMGIDTRDVLAGAATKWNFLPFQPGLVGGHCIGVDPYYLTHKAHEIGLTPQVILAGRGTNEAMPAFVAGKVIQACVRLGRRMPPKIAVLGVTYKANVPDIRNSKVVDLVRELAEFGAEVKVFDPLADARETRAEYGLDLSGENDLAGADAVVLAVPHDAFLAGGDAWPLVRRLLADGAGLVADLPAILDRSLKPDGVTLWRL
ncbi:nucleotide sugar dehydrogenase [Polymorphum gilvum]|uniref:UDP-glucose/GDP-mannose dehydrogenase family protein n=1 Tax=Polymorphum gilvum (strain LMG 25793 / CGMCC 1.9160 / SL003B-26A1) TaxID=991905 RepID=F2IZS7_POLGS|nr:nucleotide sugar dehydrogenase [Polymorphum gilvum]ADZ70653.1 UDP-glucose/GDP-mannose dehydrogenase family protein [Polymorphum gilvum SL003B-26A1]